MTRIALLPSAYLPALGGVEELTRHLALALTEAGDEVEVWTGVGTASGLADVEQLDGLTVRRFRFELPARDVGALARFPLAGARAMRQLRKAVADLRPEILHVQCFGPNGAYATALSRWSRVPLVVSLQGETMMDNDDAFDHSMVLRTALRHGLSHAAAVTGCSAFTLDDAERRFGLAPGRGEVIFNGVNPASAGTAGPAPALTDPGRRYVLALGRVVHKKGFDLLLRSFATLTDRHPDVDLVIGGDGKALPVLRRLASQLGVEAQVRFAGRLDRERVAEAMNGAAIFVMPSRLEPFGIVVLEGWRAGTAVIATSCGGPPEFVRDGQDGLLIDPQDTAALAGALDRLLSDPSLANRMGKAGRDRVDEFAWSRIAGQYRYLYRRVLDLPRAAVNRSATSTSP